MKEKQKIDILRDGAITFRVGGDDSSQAQEFLSTGNCLYVIKDDGVYKMQLADDIDPNRINPLIPNLNKQILDVGYENEIVAKILLTAKYLHDEKNATVRLFVSNLFEECIVLTQNVLELDRMIRDLSGDISQKESKRNEKLGMSILPSIPDLKMKLHNILVRADKVKDNLLMVCRLQFLPEKDSKPKLEELRVAVERTMSQKPQLIEVWDEMSKFFDLIRNARNASEHGDRHKIILSDFSMWPDGKVYPPLVELQSPDTPIGTLPLVEFIQFIRGAIIEHAELILVYVRYGVLLQSNPFGEWVSEFSEDERRNKFVRFYRSINLDGNYRILG